MRTHWKIAIAVAVLGLGWLMFGQKEKHEPAQAQPLQSSQQTDGQVGALGRIEPRSRVVRVSHDAGPEGARIGELKVSEGAQVAQGDIIAVFSDRPRKLAEREAAFARITMLESRIKAEESNLRFTKKDYERHRNLAKERAVSVVENDAAERDYMQSQAQLNALRAELDSAKAEAQLADEQLKQSVLPAPMSGTVLKIHAWPGERVGDAGVVEMADLSALDVVAEIYERDMPRVRVGQTARIFVPGMEDAFDGEVRELGFLVRKNDVNDTDPLADRDNRVIEVRITLPATAVERLRHLLYMQVDVRLQ